MPITSFSWKNFPTTGGITTGGIGSSSTNLCNSDGTNKATSCGFGRFFDPRAYKWESEPFDIPSNFVVPSTYATGFTFSVKFLSSAVTPNSTWSIYLELVQVTGTGPVTYGTVYPLSDYTAPAALVNRTDEPTCEMFVYSPGTDPDNGIISAGKYVLRIRFVTSNAVSSNNVCFDFDNIGLVFTTALSGDYEGDLNGLSQPLYLARVTNASVNTSGKLISDVSITKSTQSSVSCPDNGIGDVKSHCATTEVACTYYSIGYPKNQSGYDVIPFFATIESFTIPYQADAYVWTKTGVVHEDANNTYLHFFSVPEWSTEDNYTFVNKTFQVPTPAKPARTLSVGYNGGQFSATLSGPITVDLSVVNFGVEGFEPPEYKGQSPCTNLIETDDWTPASTIPAGSTNVTQTNNGLTCNSARKRVYITGNVNGVSRTNGSTFDINGHQITLNISGTNCTIYPC